MAVQVGMFAGDQILFQIAKVVENKGVALAHVGKTVLGNSLKIASPFIRRLGSAFVIYDLVQQVDALKAGNKEAIIDIVGDILSLTVDGVEIGIVSLEAMGVITGVSGPLAPVTLTITTGIFVTVQTIKAVREVDKVDGILHLTESEKWSVGILAAFGISNWYKINANLKSMNDEMAANAMKFLNEHKNIKRIIFPSVQINIDDKYLQANYMSVKPDKWENIQWDRSGPDNPQGGRIFCSPYYKHSYVRNKRVPSDVTHKCYSAIGVASLDENRSENVLFNLGDVHSFIIGFYDWEHIFIIGNNFKLINGRNKDDTFIFMGAGKLVKLFDGDTSKNKSQIIIGNGGINTFDVSRTTLNEVIFDIDIRHGRLDALNIQFRDMHKFVGRKSVAERIYPKCDTLYIESQGGNWQNQDQIVVTEDNCCYNLTLKIDSNTFVQNVAHCGNFVYIIQNNVENVKISDDQRRLNEIAHIRHSMIMNCSVVDIASFHVDFDKSEIRIAFNPLNDFPRTNLHIQLPNKYVDIVLKDQFKLKILNNALYAVNTLNIDSSRVLRLYSKLAVQLNMTMIIKSEADKTTVFLFGNTFVNIFSNDPNRNTVIVLNGGDSINIFKASFAPNFFPRRVDIIIRQLPNVINTLDLRSLYQHVRRRYNSSLILLPKVHSLSKEPPLVVKILKLDLILRRNSRVAMTIQLGRFIERCEKLHIILRNAPLTLNCNQLPDTQSINIPEILKNYKVSDYVTAVPLEFNATELIVIGKYDVEPHTTVIVRQILGNFRYVRFNDDLIVTNTMQLVNATSYVENICSVIFKNFTKNTILFFTLSLQFDDRMISLNTDQNQIERATMFENLFD